MTFISYAQNYEDVILWRVLKNIEKGFYIDVGAMDPTFDSITKAFYDAGWRGMNIEPAQQWFTKIMVERPDEINLQVAIGDKDSFIDFYEVLDTGLSTIDADWILPLAEEKGYQIKHSLVTMKTLNSICEEYQVPQIQFLKIDVEGAENLVLKGLDFKKYRPWIILVESTIPSSQVENYSQWEPLLKNNDYMFVYFDGLNRFYVSKEYSYLADQLAIPPNVFDGFITRENYLNITELTKVNSSLAQIQSELDRMKVELSADRLERERIQIELNAVQSDRVRIQTELSIIKSDREKIQFELIGLQSNRDQIQEELNEIQFRKNQIQEELNIVQSDRNRIQAELNETRVDRDRFFGELDKAYKSRSYRLTKPLREVAWFFRRLPGNYIKAKNTARLQAFSSIHTMRMLPLFAPLYDSIKKGNPILWTKVRNKMLDVQMHSYAMEQPILATSDTTMDEDEQYFLDLFQHEIEKR
jgi:FkbM family methyltransferase